MEDAPPAIWQLIVSPNDISCYCAAQKHKTGLRETGRFRLLRLLVPGDCEPPIGL